MAKQPPPRPTMQPSPPSPPPQAGSGGLASNPPNIAAPPLAAKTNGNGAAPRAMPIAPTQLTGVWPIPGDAADLRAIVEAQTHTIAANEALLHAYQSDLNAAQNPPSPAPATGTGTAQGNQLNVTAVTGTIVNGAVVGDGVTVPANTTILGQISGTPGGAGLYLTSQPTTAAGTALTFTAPPPPSTWPTPTDAPTLNTIAQVQTAIARVQNALIQHYQDLLNVSVTTPPPTGP